MVKYEVMDGCPHKGEIIPIRLYLSGVDLTPSHKNLSGKLIVKHFINLVLVDEEDRRYFK
jgi:vacuolar protein sorting-associated protein 26